MSTPNPIAPSQEKAHEKVTDLGRYRLIAELARGGMGVVYLALVRGPAGFKKLLVVKELMPHFATDATFMTMFLDEARVAARLNHPNVVQTLEVGEADGRPFIAMEYLEGQTLQRIVHRSLRRGMRLPLPLHLHAIVAMLGGLHYAHELREPTGASSRFVHRDVTPHNLFVTYAGEVKVIDFGISKSDGGASEKTRVGVLKGKVGYMAPEQTRGEEVDRRADIYAAGVMLWEALTGRRLWRGENDLAVLRARLSDPLIPPRALAPETPIALERIAMRALADAKEDRYTTADEMRADLEDYLALANPQAHAASRALGAHVTQLFADERAQIAQRIDVQMRELERARSADFGVVDLLQLPSRITSVTPTDFSPASRPPAATEPLEARRRPSRTVLASACVAIAAAAALVFAMSREHVHSAPKGAAVEQPAATVSPPSTPAPNVFFAPVVEALPDSSTLATTAATSDVPSPLAPSPRPHRAWSTKSTSAPRAVEAPVAPSPPTPAAGHKPIREIDLTDPYGHP